MPTFTGLPPRRFILFWVNYFGFRFYDPNNDAWLNRDPIAEAGGINLYLFVGNNPISRINPHGLMDFHWYNPISLAPGRDTVGRPTRHRCYPHNSRSLIIQTPAVGTRGLRDKQRLWGETGAQVGMDIGKTALENAAMAILGALGPGEAEGAYAAADEVLQAARAAKAGTKCFKSFDALKRAYPNSTGKVWHHIVEQSQIPRFGANAIQNIENVVEVSPSVNQSLNALYSSINPEITGSTAQTVRQWLKTQSFEQARAFGVQAVQNVQSGMWP